MQFLLNDVVFTIEPPCPAPLQDEQRFDPLDLDAVIELACERFSEHPELQRTHPECARRIAWLLSRKSEGLNAALFTAPHAQCEPELVEPRFCVLPDLMMRQLHNRSVAGKLAPHATDEEVWGLYAA